MGVVPTAALVGAPVGAFNVITLEHAEGIVAGAERARRPVILQISQNAVAFHGGRLGPIAAATRAIAAGAAVDVALHLDHVDGMALFAQAAEHGFGSAMFDGSALPYEQNVAATAAAARRGHDDGLWVESELGTVGGKHGEEPLPPHAPGARTDPAEAAAFVAATGVDGLAVAVGSTHARRSRDALLDHDRIAALCAAVPVPLVLHGSSGVPDDELRRAVAGGIVKVNIGTALNVAFTGAVGREFQARPEVVDPRRYLAPARDAVADTVARYLTLLAT
jgi:fructose-bisphosphate aldolase class II